MTILLNALSAAAASLLFVEVLMIDLKIKALLGLPESFGLKPLDCPLCLSFWTGLILGLCTGGMLAGFQTACIAVLCERIIYKQNWL
tara:strand:- start:239 stop:499 length:261 start_codon:yes stop_codon:yes gene_type:complete